MAESRAIGPQMFFHPVNPVDPVKIFGAILSVAANPIEYQFNAAVGDGAEKREIQLGTIETKQLSTEKIGGFTGDYLGMYATGNGRAATVPADFDWFEYRVLDR